MLIEYEKCIHCQEEFIRSDKELVCEKCIPLFVRDEAIFDIGERINILEKIDSSLLKDRLRIITHLKHRLHRLTRKILEDV